MEEDQSVHPKFKETFNLEDTSLDSKRHLKFLLNSTQMETDQLVTVNSHPRLNQRAHREEDEYEIIGPFIII